MPTTTHLLQQAFILATGRAASAGVTAELEAMVARDNGFAGVGALIESYVGSFAAAHGAPATVQMLAENGLGMALSLAEAAAVHQQLLAAGMDSWAKVFEFVIGMSGGAFGVLDSRADVGIAFNARLAGDGHAAYYSGALAEGAVTTWIQSVGTSADSVAAATAGLLELSTRLQAGGSIRSTAIDGYVVNGTVFVDADGDGVKDAGEFSTTTDAAGNFVLPPTATGTVVVTGGTDMLTGRPFQGTLTAPAGAAVATPFTSVIEAMVRGGTGVAQAMEAVKEALGIPGDIDLLSYDPMEILASASASAVDRAQALELAATALQVSNLVAMAGGTLEAASGEPGDGAMMQALAAAVLEAQGSLDLTDGDTLAVIILEAAGQNNVDFSASTALVVAASNEAAADASTIVELSQAAVVSQGAAADALEAAGASGTFAAAVAQFTGSALDAAVNAAPTGHITQEVPVQPPRTGNGGGGRDVRGPEVEGVAITQAGVSKSGHLNAGDSIYVTLSMSEETILAIGDKGSASIDLAIGGSTRSAHFLGKAGQDELVFVYRVQAGDTDADGIQVSANTLVLLNSTMADASGNAADLSHPGASSPLMVDTTAPTQTPTIRAFIDDEPLVTGELGAGSRSNDILRPELVGNFGGPLESAALPPGEELRVFDGDRDIGGVSEFVQPQPLPGQSYWRFVDTRWLEHGQVANYAIRLVDAAGNAGPASTTFTITFDTQAPTTLAEITSLADDVGSIFGDLPGGSSTDDTSVTIKGNFGAADAGASLAAGESLLVFDGEVQLGTASLTVVGGGQSTWTFADSRTLTDGQALSYTVRTVDEAGNAAVGSTFTAKVDTTPPTLAAVDIVDAVEGDIVGLNEAITYTVSFDEAVDTVDVSDFENGAVGGPAITVESVKATAEPEVFTVTVSSATQGNVQLALKAGAQVIDLAGNAMDTTLAVIDEVVIAVDGTAPTASSFSTEEVAVQSGAEVSYTVTFGEAMDADTVGAAIFTNAAASNPAAIEVLSVTASSATEFEVVVKPTGTGNLQLGIVSGSQAADVHGNILAGAPSDDDTVVVENTRPVFQSAATSEDGTQIVLSYDEALDEGNPPLPEAFTVMVGGEVAALDDDSPVEVVGDTVVLTLAAAITEPGSGITLYYDQNAVLDEAEAVQDIAGNDANDLNEVDVHFTQAPALEEGPAFTETMVSITASDASLGDSFGLYVRSGTPGSYAYQQLGTDLASLTPASFAVSGATSGALVLRDAGGLETDTSWDILMGSSSTEALTAAAGRKTALYGQNGSDTLSGSAERDAIFGGGGGDTILGFSGEDTVDGGTGTDTLELSATSADLNGAADGQVAALEKVVATAAANVDLSRQSEGFQFTGSNGADSITGGAGADNLAPGSGDDIIHGFAGADTVNGGANTDTLLLPGTSAELNAADNTRLSNVENVTATAAATINLSAQTEALRITGSPGADNITGGGGSDTLVGFAGADTLDGGANTDILLLAATSAELNAAADAQLANIENFTLSGAAAASIDLSRQTESVSIQGNAGADTLTSGSGSDTLSGGLGADILDGKAGFDQFRFSAADEGTDTLLAFETSKDRIGIASALVNLGGTTATASGATLDAAHFFSAASVSDIANSWDNGVVALSASLAATDILTQVVTGSGAPTDLLVLVHNSTTSKVELWFDTNWEDTLERVQLASFADILTGVTFFGNANFVEFT